MKQVVFAVCIWREWRWYGGRSSGAAVVAMEVEVVGDGNGVGGVNGWAGLRVYIPMVGLELSSYSKMVLGSRPPGCVNKCMSCRPCMAILVIPPHVIIKNNKKGFRESSPSSHREDDNYYLLSWKCRCGNKLYQP
ncbi:hypothetical protein RHMOL_Rhmol08G0286600 [Rhododendron molle]|uniref:Uncharacterized protein n=1 Tax=Rhododendron molle TaxID=49168 RepID=A0ACC0MTJ5_RHOML|nr:hypothetical protein RHMOL_Rhmol08G0286600 [Rhododendron molle]